MRFGLVLFYTKCVFVDKSLEQVNPVLMWILKLLLFSRLFKVIKILRSMKRNKG